MTVTSQANKAILLGNGVLGTPGTPFTFSFNAGYFRQATSPAVALSYLRVIYTDAAGIETEVDQGPGLNQCQITLNQAVAPNLWGAGGEIVYRPGGNPIASGTTLTVYRELPLTQLVSLQNQASYGQNAQSTEEGLDMQEMQLQQVSERQGRAISVPIVDSVPPIDLPPAAQRANKALVFAADGQPTAGSLPASGVISSAMQPVVSAATLAAGRTAFGLRDMATENIGAGLADDGANAVRIQSVLRQVAADQNVGVGNHTDVYLVSGTRTFTLARANTTFSGFRFTVFALNAQIIFTPDANDSFQGLASGASLIIPKGAVATLTTNALSSGTWWANISTVSVPLPQGYLTLTTGQPVIANDVIAATAIYYTPDAGGFVPIFDGANVQSYPFAQLTLTLAAQHLANQAYDGFITLLGGVVSVVSGPAWRNPGQAITAATNATPIVITANSHGLQTGDDAMISGVMGNTAANGRWVVTRVDANTYSLDGSVGNGAYTSNTGHFASRGAGAGTSELTRGDGFAVNAQQITGRNGGNTYTIEAGRGTYVGSFVIDGTNGQVTCHRSYGQSRKWSLWNAYNQKLITLRAGDSTASWTYATSAWRQARNQTANSLIAFLGGVGQLDASYADAYENTAGGGANEGRVGVGWQSTSSPAGRYAKSFVNGTVQYGSDLIAQFGAVAMGAVTVAALEYGALNDSFKGTEAQMLLGATWLG